MSCKPFETCFEFHNQNRKIVTLTDKKSSTTYIYENNSSNKLTKYRVDDCLIDDHNSKCDFLLLNCDKKESYFVELKGSDLIKAVEQIDRSIDLLHSKFKDFSVNGRIVLTRVNTTDLKNTKLIRLEEKIKRLNGNLKKQTRQMTEVN